MGCLVLSLPLTLSITIYQVKHFISIISFNSFKNPAGEIIAPILQIRKLRLRQVYCHTLVELGFKSVSDGLQSQCS